MKSSFQKDFFVHGGISAGIIIALMVIILFVGSDISSRAGEIRTLKNEESFRNQAIESLVTLQVEQKRAQPYFSILETILPRQDSLINFPKSVKSLAVEHNLNAGFIFGSETPGNSSAAGSIAFQLTVDGLLTDVLFFLDALRESQYLVSFDSIEMNSSTDGFSVGVAGNVFSQ